MSACFQIRIHGRIVLDTMRQTFGWLLDTRHGVVNASGVA